MRASIVALATVAILAAPASAAPAAGTSLRLTYWEDSAKPLVRVSWTLRCNPTGGSLPRPERACVRLLAGGAMLFAPTPGNAVCTEIYGGPQRVRATGLVAGKRVWTTFTRADGCAIARWNRLSPWLLPPGGVT